MPDTSSDRTLSALLELEADASPSPGAAVAQHELAEQLCVATLDERVDLFLRAVHGSEQMFTAAVRAAARDRILTAMAADIAEKASGVAPSSPEAPGVASARSEDRATWSFRNLLRSLQLGLPAAEGFAMRAARMAAVPLIALLVVGSIWTGASTYLGPMLRSTESTTSGVPATDLSPQAPQGTTRSLAPPGATPRAPETGAERKAPEVDHLAARRPSSSGPIGNGGREEALRREISNAESALGLTHPEVAEMVVKLASLYQSQARYGEAEALYSRALAIRELALGPGHPDVGQTLEQLAQVHRAQGRIREAEELSKRALGIVESTRPR